jgi:3-hydroxyisobutyrate dehydrogenase
MGETKMAKKGTIGLVVMGYPMAGYLNKGGHEVTVYNT